MGRVLVNAIQREYADAYYYGKTKSTVKGKQPERSTELTRLLSTLAYEIDDDDIIADSYALYAGGGASPLSIHRGITLAKSLIRNYVSNGGIVTDKNEIPAAPVYRIAKYISAELVSISPWLAYSIVKDAAKSLNYVVLPFKQ